MSDADPRSDRSAAGRRLVEAFAALTVIAMIVGGLCFWWIYETAPVDLSDHLRDGMLAVEARSELKKAGYSGPRLGKHGLDELYERPGSRLVVLWIDALHSDSIDGVSFSETTTPPPGFVEFLRSKVPGWWNRMTPKPGAAP